MVDISHREKIKIEELLERVSTKAFSAVDVEALIIKLRDYFSLRPVFREVADFVAHSSRDKGLVYESIRGFSNSVRFSIEYSTAGRLLDLRQPIPGYVYGMFLDQINLVEERVLIKEFRTSRTSFRKKMKTHFEVVDASGAYVLKAERMGSDFLKLLNFLATAFRVRQAFDISEFFNQLVGCIRDAKVQFDYGRLAMNQERIALAVLCLIGGSRIDVAKGVVGLCRIGCESPWRIIKGRRPLPDGRTSDSPNSFGSLLVAGFVDVDSTRGKATIGFPVIQTHLDAQRYCHPSLISRHIEESELVACEIEEIVFCDEMRLDVSDQIIAVG